MLVRRTPFQVWEVTGINEQIFIPVCSLEVATWVCGMSGHGDAAATRRWSGSPRSLLVPSEAQDANESCSVSKRDRECGGLRGRFWWEGLDHSWQVRLRLEALGAPNGS